MSIARRLLSIEAGQVRPFKFTIQVGANQLFELPLTAPGGPNIIRFIKLIIFQI